jgi:ribosome maturation factor RimP
MDLAGRVAELIRLTLESLDYDLVRVLVLGRQRVRVQVMAERTDGGAMQVEDCATISRALSPLLDVEDPIPGAYTLEVSSPGLDRPLVRPRDFERFAGFEARVELQRPLDGRRRFQGMLLGLDGDRVRLRAGESEVALPYADIQRAKLVLTDELLAQTR